MFEVSIKVFVRPNCFEVDEPDLIVNSITQQVQLTAQGFSLLFTLLAIAAASVMVAVGLLPRSARLSCPA